MRLPALAIAGLLCWVWTVAAEAADPPWARFRGPNGCGVGEAPSIPTAWTDGDYRWKTALPGVGFSSPVIWEGRLYLTSALEDQSVLVVFCLSTVDGSVLWKRQFPVKPHPKVKANIDASATPALDNDRLYLVWGTPHEHVVVALDQRCGREVWRRDLGPFVAEDGFANSPVLAGEVVVVANDQDPEGKSSLVALDRRTGQVRWQVERKSKKASFSTPCLFEPAGGRTQVIVISCAHGISSFDPASGAKNWELDAFELRTTGSPLVVADRIFAANGAGTAGKYVVAARAGVPEKGLTPAVLYRIGEAAPYVPTPVAKWPLVFLWTDRGVATCVDGPTGRVHWRERVGGDYLGSPIRIGDRIYCTAKSGEMVVLAAAEKYQLLARFNLGEACHSTPAVADGRMYLRTLSQVMCLGGK